MQGSPFNTARLGRFRGDYTGGEQGDYFYVQPAQFFRKAQIALFAERRV
jgi:hypothetical protein